MKIPLGNNEVDSASSSTPSTPVGPTPAGADWTDEPIHIINVSLQYEDLEASSDADLSKKCYSFIQVCLM